MKVVVSAEHNGAFFITIIIIIKALTAGAIVVADLGDEEDIAKGTLHGSTIGVAGDAF